jgi:signal peptidase
LKLPKPISVLVTLVLLASAAAFALYGTGNLPYRVYVVHTGSMSPTIPSESAVVVREGRYAVGQVISFTVHGAVVSHRLIAISPSGRITTKGDANRTADPWHVPVSNIIGGVVAAPRHLGYLITYMKTPQGGASILMALLCVWQIWALTAQLAPPGGPIEAPTSRLMRFGPRRAKEGSARTPGPSFWVHGRFWL